MKNYHTHTTRCMHAIGSEEEYILAAISAGYTELGCQPKLIMSQK